MGWTIVSVELEYLLRLVLAAICGACVGLEREKRQKSAGLRTHIIVAMASALMMIVSKYGFFDVVVKEGISLDASRIAAGVVTAIGFIGAGVIFIRGDNAVGLTTAAGLWATVGIGITIGAGMYIVGVVATLLMIIIQVVMHWKKLNVVSHAAGSITVNLSKNNLDVLTVRKELEKYGIFIKNYNIKRDTNRDLKMNASVILSKRDKSNSIITVLEAMDYIESLDIYTLN